MFQGSQKSQEILSIHVIKNKKDLVRNVVLYRNLIRIYSCFIITSYYKVIVRKVRENSGNFVCKSQGNSGNTEVIFRYKPCKISYSRKFYQRQNTFE